MKILMVCLGNICRSPIAEGIMQNKLAKRGIEAVVDSAGVLSYHAGEKPDLRAITVSRKFNVDISGQRARQFNIADFSEFDFIFTMDYSVFKELKAQSPVADPSNLFLFLAYAGYGTRADVPDPYYGDEEDFDRVFRMIDNATDIVIDRMLEDVKK